MARFVRRKTTGQRKTRAPSFNYHLKNRPWQVQPFFCTPVLPGETVENILWKQTTVSDPVPNRLIGWWLDQYVFYVRTIDMFPASDLKQMFVDPEFAFSQTDAADVKYFHKYGVNWAKEALRLIIENYFRADDEVGSTFEIDGLPAASVQVDSWLDSAMNSDDYEAAIDVNLTVGVDDAIGMRELEGAMRLYDTLREQGLVDMTYEDYCRTYGVRLPVAEQAGKPILLGRWQKWTMPSNTVEPTTGVATTAMYWNESRRHDKNFLVKEPGFLIGLQVLRPKVYLSAVQGSLTGVMNTAKEWLPAILRGDREASLVELTNTTGPISVTSGEDYIVDITDLFYHGEQFVNFATTVEDANFVALPSATLQKRYPSLTDAKEMFVDDASDGTKQFVETDGRCDLRISSAVPDNTPSIARLAI